MTLSRMIVALAILFVIAPAHAIYNADLGRWMTRDPLEYADGPNAYQYSRSSPINLLDASGLFPIPPGMRESVDQITCRWACLRDGKPDPLRWGITVCIGGLQWPCLCDNNIRLYSPNSACFRASMEECAAQHEWNHVNASEPPCKSPDSPCLLACRECRENRLSEICLENALDDCLICAMNQPNSYLILAEQARCHAEIARAVADTKRAREQYCMKCLQCYCQYLSFP